MYWRIGSVTADSHSASDSSGQTTRILAPILVHVTRSHSHWRSGQSGVSVLHTTNHHPPHPPPPPPPPPSWAPPTTHCRWTEYQGRWKSFHSQSWGEMWCDDDIPPPSLPPLHWWWADSASHLAAKLQLDRSFNVNVSLHYSPLSRSPGLLHSQPSQLSLCLISSLKLEQTVGLEGLDKQTKQHFPPNVIRFVFVFRQSFCSVAQIRIVMWWTIYHLIWHINSKSSFFSLRFFSRKSHFIKVQDVLRVVVVFSRFQISIRGQYNKD